MTKPQVIRWLKGQKEIVLAGMRTKHSREIEAYKHHFVLARTTAFEREEVQSSARMLFDEHSALVRKLTTDGPNPAWSTRMGDVKHIAQREDMVHYLVERLDFKDFLPFENLKDKQAEQLEATEAQWDQLIAHGQTLGYRDLLTFLDGLDLTPPPEEKVVAPALPMIAFDREVLMGVK